MGESQTRVTFDFSGEREVHYLAVFPKVGDFVTHLRELWIVRKIEEDGIGTLISCELPSPGSNGSVT